MSRFYLPTLNSDAGKKFKQKEAGETDEYKRSD